MKTKKQRQKWWKRQSPEEQTAFIEKKVLEKAIKRRKKSLRIMKKYGDKYSCKKCFHRATKSCTDDLPNGCEYWFNPNTKKTGIAYK
jgi:hypothetical protein